MAKIENFVAVKGQKRVASDGFNDFEATRLDCSIYDRKGEKADDDQKVVVGTPLDVEGGTKLMMSDEVGELHFRKLEEAFDAAPKVNNRKPTLQQVADSLTLPLVDPASGKAIISEGVPCIVSGEYTFSRINGTLN